MRVLVALALLCPTSALACGMPRVQARDLAQLMEDIDVAADVAPIPAVAAAPAPAREEPTAPSARPAPKPSAAPSVIPEVAAQPDS